MKALKRIAEGALELLYPSDCECLACGNEEGMGTGFGICECCLEEVGYGAFERLRGYWCLTAFRYEGVGETLIKKYKYGKQPHIARTLAKLMLRQMEQYDFRADLCCPVPLHPKRERMRGFNQSDLIMRLVAEELGVPYEKKLLRRTRNTAPQAGKSQEERQKAMKNVFACEAPLEGKRVFILDDVITTGSTILACAEVVERCGGIPILLACARA